MVLDLVGLIYEAASAPERWDAFLSTFARAVNGQATCIFAHNTETMEARASTTIDPRSPTGAVNFDPTFVKSLAEYYNFVNVWAQNEEILKPGRVVTGSMLYPTHELPRTEFFADWLRPQDLFHAVGGLVDQDGPWATKFSCMRSARAGDYDRDELRLYDVLLPHLARAARVQRRFAFLQSLSSSTLTVLDTISAGIVLLDGRGRVLHANATAEGELRCADPIKVSASGELRTRSGTQQAALRMAIAAAIDPIRSVNEKVSTFARLRRRDGELVLVQALPLPQHSGAVRVQRIHQHLAACALVIRSSSAVGPAPGSQLLQHLYGLTPAEIRAARVIAQGKSIPEAAELLRISRNTLKTQLKAVFSKTGTHRQGELVRLWHDGAPPREKGKRTTETNVSGTRASRSLHRTRRG